MRKVFISFSNSAEYSERNANEYSVYPKTNTFGAEFDGNSITAAFTSGKGKSAVPNYYLYFRDEKGAIYYFRSNPAEIEEAKKGFRIYSTEPVKAEPEETPPESAEEPTGESEPESADPVPPSPETIGANEAEKGIGPVAPKRRRVRN